MNIFETIHNKLSAVLELNEVLDVQEDLFYMGLDSIKVIQLIVMLEEELGIDFEPEDLLIENFVNVEQIATTINKYVDGDQAK